MEKKENEKKEIKAKEIKRKREDIQKGRINEKADENEEKESWKRKMSEEAKRKENERWRRK